MVIEYLSYNKESLRKYVESDEYLTAEHVAISQHRAISQYLNPRCRAEDILMIMAWDGVTLVGYLGILPDDLYLANEKNIHLGWLSCLWVNPKYRGKGVAGNLLKSALEAYNNNIILTEFTPEAGQLYEKSGHFVLLKCIDGIRYYYRFCLSALLPQKNKIFRRLKLFLKLIDSLFNSIGDLRFTMEAFPAESVFSSRIFKPRNIGEICPKASSHRSSFRRTIADFDWIFSYPWIVHKDEKFRYSNRYYFSAVDPSFENLFYQSKDNEGEFIWLTYRNSHLKTAYMHYQHADHIKIIIEKLLRSGRVNYFSTYDTQMINILDKLDFKPIFSKKIQRRYMVSRHLMDKIVKYQQKVEIEDGDGDCIFT